MILAIFAFMVDKRTHVRYNQNIEHVFFGGMPLCQN